tara:strand:+ start:256 stop:1617 length:1362 start_codon:yes stop_codon:yes gene_type:complete
MQRKAAPRFELGIKDLQSSALPLGHAAVRGQLSPTSDRISRCETPLLVLCNGHGEDLIALRVLEAIHCYRPQLALEVLPLVGRGRAFDAAISEGWLQRVGPSAALPSGGFSNQSFKGLLADLKAGLPLLSWRQWYALHQQVRMGRVLLAVGDLLPLLMACCSGSPFGFIGTPKSDYTWRSGPGRAFSDWYHRIKGSEWDPWEWGLMNSHRCRLVAVRDRLTARGLRRHGIDALAPGNPMMDGLMQRDLPAALMRCKRVLLLCGSRMPEASSNFRRLLNAVSTLEHDVPIALLAAVGNQPPLDVLEHILSEAGFRRSQPPTDQLQAASCWVRGPVLVLIGRGCFEAWAGWAEAGLATAGTATEQLVGLGVPTLSLPGPGPQFKWSFARRQSRLLGGAVHPCQDGLELTKRLNRLLCDPPLRLRLGRIGQQRMGPAGGSDRLARLVLQRLHGIRY